MRTTQLRSLRLGLALTLLLAAAWVPAAVADTKLLMKTHTDAFQVMGQNQPAQDGEVTIWIGDDRASRSDGDTTVIFRGDQDKVYLLNHPEKNYAVLEMPIDLMAGLPAETRQQMESVMKAMEMTAEVEPTDQRKEINGWSTRLYRVHLANSMGMKIESQVWVTDDIDVDVDSFREMSTAIASLQPGGTAIAEEILKIDGVPVLMESDIQAMGGGTKSREELTSAATEAAPAGSYEVPAGYEKKEFDPMGQGR